MTIDRPLDGADGHIPWLRRLHTIDDPTSRAGTRRAGDCSPHAIGSALLGNSRLSAVGSFVLLFCAAWTLGAVASETPAIRVWPVDPLVKVFPDDPVGAECAARAEVARGEHASLQVVVRADTPIRSLRAAIRSLDASDGSGRLDAMPARFVGYVPVDRPTQKPSQDQLRKPPADYPDPLLELDSIDVAAGRAQAVWITVPIPLSAVPGMYRGALEITGVVAEKPVRLTQRLEIQVYPASIARSRLWVTDWFAMQWRHLEVSPQPESEDYYALLRRYARNLAEHRHNVALISPLNLATFTVGPGGGLGIDFARFDRWVNIFREEGVIGRIEGGHIGGRKAGWDSDFVVTIHRVEDDKVVSASVDPAGADAERFYAQFFPALVAHLKERGWLSDYLQHLADEPTASNLGSYRAMAALIRKHAPELRVIEACHTKDLVGAIDVWVPQLNFLHDDFAHYTTRRRAGDEVWFYTCVFPQGEYANRFIEQPLIKTRLLHWINFRYGVTGYLHWGYNHWTENSPFTHTTRPHGGPPYLPAGDPWIVYPGKDGPLDSIRFEAMRDGIADHELLSLLAQRDPEAAQQIAGRHVLAFDRYNTDVVAFRAARRELIERLSDRVSIPEPSASVTKAPEAGLEVELTAIGDWDVRVTVTRREPGQSAARTNTVVQIAPPEAVEVAAERHDSLPLFNPNTGGWMKGARLRLVQAQETTTPFLVDPRSVVLRAGPDLNAPVFKPGIDYDADLVWGTIGRTAQGGIREGQPVYAAYRCYALRLDALVLRPDGTIDVRRGEPRAAAPKPGPVRAGEVHLANIWLPGRVARLGSTNLLPIRETSYPEPALLRPTPIEQFLPKTLARLETGQLLRVLAWGDSVTDGSYLSDPDRERWQAQFVERLQAAFPKARIELVTEAWGGRNTASYLAEPPGAPHNYREKVLGAQPHLIVSEFVNDAGLDAAQVEERYGRLLEDFSAIGAEWIILTPHYVRPDWMGLDRECDIDNDPRPYVAGLRQFAGRHGVALADAARRYGRLWRQGIPYTALMLNSINHPDADGMKIFADALMALGWTPETPSTPGLSGQ